MNFKRKNKTNRSLNKKTAGLDYGTPKIIKRVLRDRKNDNDIKGALNG